MFLTMCTTEEIDLGKEDCAGNCINKLRLVHKYNQKIGGIDKNDAMVNICSFIRKSHKWFTKVIFQFLEEAIFSLYLLYNKAGHRKCFLEFRFKTMHQMLKWIDSNIVANQTFDCQRG